MRDAWWDLVSGGACVGCGAPGRLLCATCTQALPTRGRAAVPTPCPPGLGECWVAGDYADALRAMVVVHKERRAFALARPLGRLLATAALGLVDRPAVPPCRVLLVPVPSRPDVVRARGHDPMLRVCRVAAGVLRSDGYDARVARLLRQAVRPADQSGLSATARADNLAGTLATRTPALRALARDGRPVLALVCDDVLTTGATAQEARRALVAVGVPVAGVACVAATVRRLTPGRTARTRDFFDDPQPGAVYPQGWSH